MKCREFDCENAFYNVLTRLRTLSYTDTDLFILLCSLGSKESLLNIRSELEVKVEFERFVLRFKWIREVRHFSPRSQKVLVVTGCDLGKVSLISIQKLINLEIIPF